MKTPRIFPGLVAAVLAGLLGVSVVPTQADKFPPPVNTQNPKDVPPTPQQALALITAPRGFQVTLFAGEPDVQQPIAMSLDDRGRLWVAECYTYAGGNYEKSWTTEQRDRVLIFEDTDHDGRFDKRTVFWDRAQNLSGVATGFGGVWLLCAPNLLFLPDRNGDDVPDGPPQVVLDGWAVGRVGHNIVNGLTWGPDGWLYGRHGIQDTSLVGKPGATESQRTKLNCSIWRYHPTKQIFEVVTQGTTNPWGLDYDDHGQMFFTNNVNGHLWHVIPGAHYKRMYGEDFTPHVYELLDQHADHHHFDTGKSWEDSREAKGKHGELGGGHSHCGGMIYLGDNWPPQYRNTIFMCNTHGRRVNNDRLVRFGCGYVARHGEDFLFANNPWFRGIDLKYGPDGGVYLSDWVDSGECHDHDGVHRTSGRVYKVTYGKAPAPRIADVSRLSDAELVHLQLHRNDWYVRVARRNLQERAAAGHDMKAVHKELLQIFHENKDETRKLRALWALYVTGGAGEAWLRQQLSHESEHVRTWAVRLLTDQGAPGAEALKQFVRLAREDPSGLVRLFLASALQRLPVTQRAELASALLGHAEDATDHNMPLMIWYGVGPLAAAEPGRAVELAEHSRIPLVRRLIARRLTEEVEKAPGPLNELLKRTADQKAEFQIEVLQGMTEALRGWRKARPPEAWAILKDKLSASGVPAVRDQVRNLSVVFGDGRALDELNKLVLNTSADGAARRAALQVLIDNRADGLVPLLQRLVNDRATGPVAVRGLAAYDHPDTPALILRHYGQMQPEERAGAIGTLVSRPAYAQALLRAVAEGKLARGDISAYHARQIHSLGDDRLNKELAKVWGEVRATPADKKQQMVRYKQLLTPERLRTADLSKGRLLFNQTCLSCHTLYGEGQKIGPDITGANRDSLDYLLENIIDPSATVGADFKMSVLALSNGRVLNGIIVAKTERTLTVQTQTERVNVERAEVDELHDTAMSLMPDGLFNALSDEQVRDLIGYLMTRQQVPLSAEASSK